MAYHIGLYLTRGYDEIITQIDSPLMLGDEQCLSVPDDAPLEKLHLRLALYNPQTGNRLDVVARDGLLWGDFVILGVVAIPE